MRSGPHRSPPPNPFATGGSKEGPATRGFSLGVRACSVHSVSGQQGCGIIAGCYCECIVGDCRRSASSSQAAQRQGLRSRAAGWTVGGVGGLHTAPQGLTHLWPGVACHQTHQLQRLPFADGVHSLRVALLLNVAGQARMVDPHCGRGCGSNRKESREQEPPCPCPCPRKVGLRGARWTAGVGGAPQSAASLSHAPPQSQGGLMCALGGLAVLRLPLPQGTVPWGKQGHGIPRGLAVRWGREWGRKRLGRGQQRQFPPRS